MNLKHIISEIAKTDPEFYERTSGRRSVMKNFGRVAAMSAIPFALGAMLNKAYGRTTSDIIGVLNFALKLEYLESEFYNKALSLSGPSPFVPAGAATAAITTIRDHELAHVNFLIRAIRNAGGTPIAPLTATDFDFTANNTFPNVFNVYADFLAVAQVLEDTGVRAYKGQAPNLMSDNATLTAALQIHSVEARHASHIRKMRNEYGPSTQVGDLKPWITQEITDITQDVSGNYMGEGTTMQLGINIVNVGGKGISANAATEAFDEYLSQQEVDALVAPFLN